MLDNISEYLRSSFNIAEYYAREPYIIPNPKISVTDLAYLKCDRCLYDTLVRKAKGTSEEFTPQTQRTFALGCASENYLIGILQKFSDCKLLSQQYTLETSSVKGKIDAVIEYKDEQYIVELKIMNNFRFSEAKKYEYVNEGYRDQVNLYLHLGKSQFPNLCTRGLFILINRDNSDILVLESGPVDDERATLQLARADRVHRAFCENRPNSICADFECIQEHNDSEGL